MALWLTLEQITLKVKVKVAFVTAESRIAPKKQQSIPRLELFAALTGAQLAKVLKTELTLPLHSVTLW